MKVCAQCVLDERFPKIRFDADGVCNFCRSAGDRAQRCADRARYEERFRRLMASRRREGAYDCLVAYSGGKDSTYMLHLLKHEYGLRLLAFSFDNWFQSEYAMRNIRTVLQNLNVDHWTIRPSFAAVKAMILASLDGDAYSSKALTRASSVCTSCISLIRFIGLRIAIEEAIPAVAFGMSPGQAPISTAVVQTNAGITRAMQEPVLRLLSAHAGESIRPFFLEDRHFAQADSFPVSVNPLAFVEYDEQTVLRVSKEHGWQKPDDTDANSTNCLLNAFANHVHMERFGFSPYAFEIAELVREGCMTRAEGRRRLAEKLPAAQIAAVKKALGLADTLCVG